jgi:hypothetical protein
MTLTGSQKGIVYAWKYDDGEVITSKNPKSRSLAPGIHEISVSASYSGSTDILWTQILSVKVDKISKSKKSKNLKTKKEKIIPKKEIQSSPISLPETKQVPEDDIPYTTMALFGGILPLVLFRRFLTGLI